jgi:hypothetical protein
MKQLTLCFLAFVLIFESCRKCKDVSIGRVDFMPESIAFLENLKGKKLIFKDSLGATITFNAASNIVKPDAKVVTKVICQEAFNPGVEFLDSKIHLLKLTSRELSIEPNLQTMISNKGLDASVSDTSLLYDVLNIDFGSIKFPLELSKRGVVKPNFRVNNQVQSEVKLLGKTFKNVVVDTNSQKTKTTEPLSLSFNTSQGIIAFRLLDGRLFVLDKIE